MPSGPHDKKSQNEDPTEGLPPVQVPETTSNLAFYSEEVVGETTLEELLAPDAAAAARSEGLALGEWILTGRREFLLRAFQTDPRTASSVIVARARTNDPRWVDIVPTLASMLASLLEEGAAGQTPAEAPAPEQKPFVRLYLARSLAWITRDSKAFDIVLSEAVALGMINEGYDAIDVIRTFEPLEVMPTLIRFIRGASGGRGQAAWQVFFAIILDLIDCKFGAYNAYRNRPADAKRCRDMTLSLLAELLAQQRLDEWIQDYVADIVWTRAASLAGDLKQVAARVGKACGVSAKRIVWRIYRAVLMAPAYKQADRETAAEWVTRHPSEAKEDPSAWRVHYCILRDCKGKAYRRKAARYLGAHVPTSTLRPLPADVAGVWKLLDSLAEQHEDLHLRREAKAAIARLVERGHEEAARETQIRICQLDSQSATALPSEWILHFVEPPRSLISLNLTIFSKPEKTSFVAHMDATKDVSLGPTAAPSLDLDLSSHQFATNAGRDGFSPGRSAAATVVPADQVDFATISFTSTDPAIQHTRVQVSGPSEKIVPAKPEQERFRDRYRALGTLVEAGQINAAVLINPMAALNEAYRGLDRAESQRVIGVSKAAEVLGLTKSRVQQLAREGLGQKVAGRFLFTREELEREKQRQRSKGGRPPTADGLDLAAVSFMTTHPAIQHTRMLLVNGLGGNIELAKPEQERFRDRYRALGTLVEAGEINTAVLKCPIAALNEAYRELEGEGAASGRSKTPPPQDQERDPGWTDRFVEREALPTTGTESDRVLGVSEAAGILGLTRSRVQQLARAGLIGLRVAGRFLFTREELEREKQRPRSKGGRPPTHRDEDWERPETNPL